VKRVELQALSVTDISTNGWTALAAWVAVLVLIAALVYVWRAYRRAREHADELLQPNVAMFMEPAANDWHLVELVVKNFGQTPAYGIRFDWAHPPTVGKYETAYGDRYVDIVPLNLPAEIPYLAPSQEWRIVWDSALDRRELGETIASRFDGAVTYSNQPKDAQVSKRSRKQFKSTAVLDWATLHPVERLELLTTHDLARQEKQKLELLRNLLAYYHYAASESREEVLRSEINRVRNAADQMRARLTDAEFSAPEVNSPEFSAPESHAPESNAPTPEFNAPTEDVAPTEDLVAPPVIQSKPSPLDDPFDAPRENPRDLPDEDHSGNGMDYDDDAHTEVINGRHRRRRF
jgi:hypothetical protein